MSINIIHPEKTPVKKLTLAEIKPGTLFRSMRNLSGDILYRTREGMVNITQGFHVTDAEMKVHMDNRNYIIINADLIIKE